MHEKCSAPNCNHQKQKGVYCFAHDRRNRLGMAMDTPITRKPSGGTQCSVEDCNRRVAARGLCHAHYQRLRKGMEVNVPVPRRGVPVKEKMAFYTAAPDKNGCRLWMGKPNGSGYGQISVGAGAPKMAHRVAYELAGNDLGPLPIHHKCGVKLCVEPSHLVVVEPHENTAEMFGRKALGERIAALENAIRALDPGHPLLDGVLRDSIDTMEMEV
jgi:hypothetical protein